MKKGLLKFGASLVMMLGLAACSSEEETGKEASEEKYELKFGMVAGNQQNEYKAAEKLAEYVEKESDGRLTIEIYPNSQLGDDRAMLEQVQAGSLDLTFAETGRFGTWVPRASLMNLPYVVDNFDHALQAVYETEYGKGLHEELLTKYNWKIMKTAYNGTRQTTSNRAIESLDDMKGLKLRVPEVDTLLDYAKFTGASPTPMAFTEVYLALQTNAVDGQENPLSTINAQKFYEVQDYLALTNHVVNDANYVMSNKKWESLPEDLQSVLEKGIAEAADYHTSLFTDEEKTLVSKFEEAGVTVTKPELEPFKKAVAEAYPKYLEAIGEGADEFLKQIQGANK